MELPQLFAELLGLCKKLALPIRQETMKVPTSRLAGGLVRLKGRPIVIVDDGAPIVDRIAALADVLVAVPLPIVVLSPEAKVALARARLRRRRARRASQKVRRLSRRSCGPRVPRAGTAAGLPDRL